MRDSVCLSCARARVVVFRGRCSSCAALVARCAAAAQPAREPNPGVLQRHDIIDGDMFVVFECIAGDDGDGLARRHERRGRGESTGRGAAVWRRGWAVSSHLWRSTGTARSPRRRAPRADSLIPRKQKFRDMAGFNELYLHPIN